MKNTTQRRRYIRPEVTSIDAVVERGFAVSSSSIEGIGESDFGPGSNDFWQ